jgi:hypothetical protein
MHLLVFAYIQVLFSFVVLETEYLQKNKINVDLLKSKQEVKLIIVVIFALKLIMLGPT